MVIFNGLAFSTRIARHIIAEYVTKVLFYFSGNELEQTSEHRHHSMTSIENQLGTKQ